MPTNRAQSHDRLVLVVEDDPNISRLVQRYLERDGFQVRTAFDGEVGLAAAHQRPPDLVILDLMLPKVDGWEVCRQLRLTSDVPILMLTARGEEVDRLLGFALTADDYVVKPFSPRELVERVKAILRRTRPRGLTGRQSLRHGELVLDPDAHQAALAGQPLDLTPTEFRLLQAFLSHPGRVLTRGELLAQIKTQGEIVVDRVVDAAHELRTPLTNVRGYLEALRDSVFEPSQETFEMLHGEVLRLVALTESLLELARADAARSDMHIEEVSLHGLVTEALELGKLQIQAKGLHIRPTLAADVGYVRADPAKLRRVLCNLIDNAWQYCPAGGRISIASRTEPDGVRLTITNDGVTFSPEDAYRVFERFYRADRSRSRANGGAGIGLAIVKELVEAHGGRVGAATDGAATSIWLTLPAQPEG